MTISYTPWADPLLDYINNDLAATTGGASSPFAPINYNADLFANEAKFFTGNFGFDGYMGVPGLVGSNAQQAAREPLIPLEGECCIRRHCLSCKGSDYPEKTAAAPNREKSAPHRPHLAEHFGAPA